MNSCIYLYLNKLNTIYDIDNNIDIHYPNTS